jgi:hypothetical protein
MNRLKDYAGFVGWFAGLGYIVLWPVTATELGGKPFGVSIFCHEDAPSLTDFLCHSAHPLELPPGLHALGFLSALFVTTRLLVHAVRRTRRAVGKSADPGNLVEFAPPPLRKPQPMRPPIRPRTQFGLRGMPAQRAGNKPAERGDNMPR